MNKLEELKNYIKSLEKVAIAFSGGVDSTFVLKVASEVLGKNAVAITIESPYIPKWEIREAKQLAKEFGCTHKIIKFDEILEEVKFNAPNRCYLCKKKLFKAILEEARNLNIKYVIDGTNIDDTKDYRPGLKALEELSIKSPLKELSITKQEIRDFSKELKLPTFNKPSYSCLLTRLESGIEVTEDKLRRTEEAELILHSYGFKAVRVRNHGDLARIEVNKEDLERILNRDLLKEISDKIKNVGYKFVSLDMDGYNMGSFNKIEVKQ
ncbi:ATP-dependent sacrificial sulfur transferase LarE [uncultured Clostridium sp.]|uniref:ATP-dependent sacrificial sulfur transferase LarE n=1 Tax=uncultured Clostridium sp. TaxID=59620 RepID=UPI002638A532|nr:ATP-dependent sacrificial sulfur transferase LarE [uncultured Clostridium sp.]